MNELDEKILKKLKSAKGFLTSTELIDSIDKSLTRGKVRCAVDRMRKNGLQIESSNKGYQFISAKGPPKRSSRKRKTAPKGKDSFEALLPKRTDKNLKPSIFARLYVWFEDGMLGMFSVRNAVVWCLALACAGLVWTHVSAEGYHVSKPNSDSSQWSFTPKAEAPIAKKAAAVTLPGTARSFDRGVQPKGFASPAKALGVTQITAGPQKEPKVATMPKSISTQPAKPVQVASLNSQTSSSGVSLDQIRAEFDRTIKPYNDRLKRAEAQQNKVKHLETKVIKLEKEVRVLKRRAWKSTVSKKSAKKDPKVANAAKVTSVKPVKSLKFMNAVVSGKKSVARLMVTKNGKSFEQIVGLGDTVNGFRVKSIDVDSVGVTLPNGQVSTIR